MKKPLIIAVAGMALFASAPAHAVEMPDQLIGQWCEIHKRSNYDGRGLIERSNGWYVGHFYQGQFSEDDCRSKKRPNSVWEESYPYNISKDHFVGCTPLHVSKMSSRGLTLEWTVKARCGGDGGETFRITIKFHLWNGDTLTTYTK
jgi:hypothetical protein